MLYILIAFHLVRFIGPDGQSIDVYPPNVVSVRPIRDIDHFGKNIRCLIHTNDQKFIAVTDDCDTVRRKLEEESNE